MHSHLIIAIDGYSSCGKSTVAKALAKRLGLNYIDSGAMYRAVTFYFMQNDIPIPAPEELHDFTYNFEPVLNDINISFALNKETGLSEVYLNGVNVVKEIRSMAISDQVSHVSAIKSVRQRMVQLQQKAGSKGGLVMDGRDIGTTVFPHADFKIFMKADPMVRAERRFKEMQQKGIDVTMPDVINNIVGRDYEDTHREESPLRKSPDAFILDNTLLTQNEQVEIVLKELAKLKEAAGTSFQ